MKITYHEPVAIAVDGDLAWVQPKTDQTIMIGSPADNPEIVYPIAVDHDERTITVLRGWTS